MNAMRQRRGRGIRIKSLISIFRNRKIAGIEQTGIKSVFGSATERIKDRVSI